VIVNTPFFALTTRGLEFVSAQEIAAVYGASVMETAYRRVAGHINSSPARLLNLRTVDDVYIDLGTWVNVSSQRSMLAVFTERARQLESQAAAALIRDFRHVSDSPMFSVTASFVGRRNYTTGEIKQAVAAGVHSCNGWVYTPDDREADLNLRLFIEHETAYVGVRLARHPLHERPYKRSQIVGSLKPPVAAALIVLADLDRGARLLDPFCGAGTILAEAMGMGYDAMGGDLSPNALSAAHNNVPAALCIRWDAGSLPLREAAFDAVISNFPWGRQIVVDQSLVLLYRRALAEIRRVLKPNSPVVLLTSTPDSVIAEGFRLVQQSEISLFGQTPTVVVLQAER
jgi:23S rRNA G2445 N2-methylase RlmL